MLHGHFVVDADAHKCENPPLFLDHIPAPHRPRLGFVRDRYGEQRIRILDRDPKTGRPDFERLFLQPDGLGKGTFRPYDAESTLGGLYNRLRLEHMDREGIDHQVIYGSVALAFSSILDVELGVALCRAYNDYIVADCAVCPERLHPVAVLPLQDPAAAVAELRRCVEGLGMPAVSIPPNLPVPHPGAPDSFPEVRSAKHLSHPDFFPIYEEAERLGIAIGVHGAPGFQLAGGCADLFDTFTLVHVFANRSMQQMALAKLVFDGVLDRFPRLRFGFLEAGCGWLPDFLHNLKEHWQRRIRDFDPDLDVSVPAYLLELAREQGGARGLMRSAASLMRMLFSASEQELSRDELLAFRLEHRELTRDPLEFARRGQLFFTADPGDPAPGWLSQALGPFADRLCGMATDYGHWDAEVRDCVALATRDLDRERAVRLVSENALHFYGDPLRKRMLPPVAECR